MDAIEKHRQHLIKSGKLEEKKLQRAEDELSEVIMFLFGEWLNQGIENETYISTAAAKIAAGKADPYHTAVAVLQRMFSGGFKEAVYSFNK